MREREKVEHADLHLTNLHGTLCSWRSVEVTLYKEDVRQAEGCMCVCEREKEETTLVFFCSQSSS